MRRLGTLPVPADGPCGGHGCDLCRACVRGRCCRRDNPHYRLPATGDWDGPLFSPLGQLEDDGERVVCHGCGRSFAQLAVHALAAHDLTAAEYKALFGLNASTGLVGPVVARRRGAAARLHLARWMATPGRAVGGDHALTPEQVSAFQAGRVVRLQARRALQGLRTAPVTVTCRLCGTPFLARASAHRVLCDDLACARLARRLRRRRDGPRGADTPAEVLAR